MGLLERMLERSKTSIIRSKEGISVRVNFTYKKKFTKEETKNPKDKFEDYLLSNLGQELFNKYFRNEIDEDLREKINKLRKIYYVP